MNPVITNMITKIGISGFKICFTLESGVFILNRSAHESRRIRKLIIGEKKLKEIKISVINPKDLVLTSNLWM